MGRHFFGKLSDILADKKGNVVILFGLTAFLLIICIGVAVDMARAQILQQRMLIALDASGLAAISDVYTPPQGTDNITWANQEANRYFQANFPAGYLSSSIQTVTVSLPAGAKQGDYSTLDLNVTGTQNTVFMSMFGISTLTVNTNSVVTRANPGAGLEVVMVLDNSGSMNCLVTGGTCDGGPSSKIAQLKSGAATLIETLLGSPQSSQCSLTNPASCVFMGIVPVSQAVNIGGASVNGTNPNNAIVASDFTGITNFPYDPNNTAGQWGGCVASNSGSGHNYYTYNIKGFQYTMSADADDRTPTEGGDPLGYYYFTSSTQIGNPSNYQCSKNLPTPPDCPSQSPDVDTEDGRPEVGCCNQWMTGTYPNSVVYNYGPSPDNGWLGVNMGPNVNCPTQVTQMTTDPVALTNAINAMTAQGSTTLNIGLAWGWRMISPDWVGHWTSPEMASYSPPLPLGWGTANSQKVVILMTDGTNLLQFGNMTAYNYPVSNGQEEPLNSDYLAWWSGDWMDDQLYKQCQVLQAEGVIIYAIGYGTEQHGQSGQNGAGPYQYFTIQQRDDPTLVNVDLLTACASPGDYYNAPSNDALQAIFQHIANELSEIRVAQ